MLVSEWEQIVSIFAAFRTLTSVSFRKQTAPTRVVGRWLRNNQSVSTTLTPSVATTASVDTHINKWKSSAEASKAPNGDILSMSVSLTLHSGPSITQSSHSLVQILAWSGRHNFNTAKQQTTSSKCIQLSGTSWWCVVCHRTPQKLKKGIERRLRSAASRIIQILASYVRLANVVKMFVVCRLFSNIVNFLAVLSTVLLKNLTKHVF